MVRTKLMGRVNRGGVGLCLLPDTYKLLNGNHERCALLLSNDELATMIQRS